EPSRSAIETVPGAAHRSRCCFRRSRRSSKRTRCAWSPCSSRVTSAAIRSARLSTTPSSRPTSTLTPSGTRALANALALTPRPLARDASFLTIAPADRLALSGVISGDANHFLVKNGAGTLELTGANTFAGGLSLEGGHLLVGHDQALGTGTLYLLSGTLGFSGERSIANAISLQTDLTLDLSSDLTLSGQLYGTAGNDVTKTGAGTLTLSADNRSLTGDFTVSAGTLQLLHANAGGSGILTLASGARLVASGTIDQWVSVSGSPEIANPAALSIGQLILNEDTVLTVAQPLTLGALRGGSERFEKTGPGSLTLSGGGLWNGEFVHSQGTLYLDDQQAAGSTSLVLAGGALSSHNAIQAVAAPVTLTRDTALPAEVEFTFIAPLTLATDVSLDVAGRLHLTQGFRDFGAGHDLSLTGDGTLVLSGASAFSGTLDHQNGTLEFNGSPDLGAGSLLLSGGALHTGVGFGTVSLGAPVTFAASTSVTGDSVLDFTGAATLEESITLTNTATVGFSGTLSAAPDLTLVKAGPGALHLLGAMDLDGGLVIRDGLVYLHNTSLSAPILIEGGGLISGTAAPIANALHLDGDFTLGAFGTSEGVFSGELTLTRDLTLTTTGAPVRLTGGLTDESNTYTLTVTGDGNLLLDGINYRSTPITLAGGQLGFTSENALGSGRLTLAGGTFYSTSPTGAELFNDLTLSGSTLLLQGFTFHGAATLVGDTHITALGPLTFTQSIGEDATPRALSFANSPAPVTLSVHNTFSGGLDLTNVTAILNSDTAAGTGPLTLANTTLQTDGFYDLNNAVSLDGTLLTYPTGGGGLLQFSGPVHLASDVHLSGDLLSLVGVISEAATPRALSTDLASLYLGGENTFSGGFSSTGTAVFLGSDTAFGTGLVTLQGGALGAYDTPITLANSIVLAGGNLSTLGDAPITLSGPVAVQADTSLQPSLLLTLSGDLTGSAPLRVGGSAPLILSGDNALYTGGVRVEGGVLHFGSNTAAGPGPIRTADFSTLGTSRSVDLANSIIATGRLDIDNAHDLRIRGGLTQSSGLLYKTGPGRLTLDGAVSLVDSPRIQAGSFYINGDLTLGEGYEGEAPALVVNSGVTVGGSGTVHGNFFIDTGGTLAPGNSAGELTIDGNATIFGPTNYVFEIQNAVGTAGVDWDLLTVSGLFETNSYFLTIDVVTLGVGGAPGPLSLFNPAIDHRWTLLTAGVGIAAAPSHFLVNTSAFGNVFNGAWTTEISPDGSNLDLVYTSAIPEPSTFAALLGLATLGASVLRRRRHKA
ncbi:MAG: autotransporter-associated beta strand repeat-containing protein, partial [Burkholderiales bacterium]|nr:autotransporter-associated beta strand repeat-containing protein [Opitutaceae bacterium]